MNSTSSTLDRSLQVDLSQEAVLQAIKLVRSTHDEVDSREIEMDDTAIGRDRRHGRRVQLQMPVILTPVDLVEDHDDQVELCGPEQIAVTRDISTQGLGIVHDMTLLTELALIQFDMPGETPVHLLYEVRWTSRKTRYSFVTGGRLIGVVTPADR